MLILGLLYLTVGTTAFIAFGAAFVLFLFQFPINALLLKLRLRIAAASDTRLSLLQTLILGIQTVKSLGWEDVLITRAKKAR